MPPTYALQILKSLFTAVLIVVMSALLICPAANATVQLPKNMNQNDRAEALRIIGFGTSAKILSDPYPLGGYSGFEVGFSIENLPAEDLGHLGSGLESPQQDVAFPEITIGKGVYDDVDIFLHFTPYNRQDELSQFGGILRWGFYQAKFLPLNAALLLHMNNGDFSNQLTTHSYGFDVVGGIDVDNVSLFAGGGILEATGTFLGGTAGITDSTAGVSTESVTGTHTLIGANLHISNLFVTLQIDRYTLPVYSGKLGVRF